MKMRGGLTPGLEESVAEIGRSRLCKSLSQGTEKLLICLVDPADEASLCEVGNHCRVPTEQLAALTRARLFGVPRHEAREGGPGCYVCLIPNGDPPIDQANIEALSILDCKFVVHSNNDLLTSADPAHRYKQLQRVEVAWRQLKRGLKLRPVYHGAPNRIHAQVVLTVHRSCSSASPSRFAPILGATSATISS